MWQAPVALQVVLDRAKSNHRTIVLATGVFDILHQEHRNFLQKAKQQGDVLIVGIETDSRVTELKGAGRPVNSQAQRQAQLEALGLADAVFVLPAQFHTKADYENLIQVLSPQILAVSSHSPHLENKQRIMSQFGGQVVVVHDHNPAISTTIVLAAQARANTVG